MEKFLYAKTRLTYKMAQEIQNVIKESILYINNSSNTLLSGKTVVVKVNIVGSHAPHTAACTHPEILRSLIKELLKYDVRIKIVEDCDNDNAPETAGILAVSKEFNLPFINLKKTEYNLIDIAGSKYNYSKSILDADYLILLPKLKTHILTNYTGAIKLMYGGISKDQRIKFHRNNDPIVFANVLVDIFSIKQPILTIMDGILSMDGVGPSHGTPNNSGLLLVSNNAVLLDYYASQYMGYNANKIDMIRLAIERFQIDTNDLTFIGDDLKDEKRKFAIIPQFESKMKRRYIRMSMGLPKFIKDRCTMCGNCVRDCPNQAIYFDQKSLAVNPMKCNQCFCCMELCCNNAVLFSGGKNG